MPKTFAATLTVFLAVALAFAAGAAAEGNPEIAALQVGLHNRGLYVGTVDGVLGPGTETALRRFQRRARLTADGVPGPRTRKALGRFGRRLRSAGVRLRSAGAGGTLPLSSSRSPGTAFPPETSTATSAATPTRRCAAFRHGPESSRTARLDRRQSRHCGGLCLTLP